MNFFLLFVRGRTLKDLVILQSKHVYPVRKMTTRPKSKVFFVFSFLIDNMEKKYINCSVVLMPMASLPKQLLFASYMLHLGPFSIDVLTES